MKALEERMTLLEGAFDTNTGVFSDGMKMLEAQHEVLRRVVQDVIDGKVVLVVAETGQRVAWNNYLKAYIEELVASEEKKKAEGQNGSTLAASDEDAPIIFGGDQA